MKKFVLIFATAFMLCTTSAMAQKVDLDALASKIEKSVADVENPKKATKASTWVALGDAYAASISKPTASLFVGITQPMVELNEGKPKSTGSEVVNGVEYQTMVYDYYTLYLLNSTVEAWAFDESKVVCKDAVAKLIEAYTKALELDSSVANKVKPSVEEVINYYKMSGNLAIKLGDTAGAADAFLIAADLTDSALSGGKADPSLYYYAGYMMTIDGASNPASYVAGEAALNKALDSGYAAYEEANADMDSADRGNIYYYLYTCAYAQKGDNAAKLNEAKDYLVEGVSKYPANERIFEGLMQLYTTEDGMGDPAELIPAVERIIEGDPNNTNAWFSRGRIYYAMKEYDECISSFKKVITLSPELYEGFFYLGLFQMLKSDDMLEVINSTSYSDQSKYNADLEALNESYAEAIPYFESAHELRPTDKGALEYLKQLCFRLRDMPGIMDKYNKYNALLQEL